MLVVPGACWLSLSARRAWIEIDGVVSGSGDYVQSLSARRAWIEIVKTMSVLNGLKVALRKESVDRNVLLRLFWFIWRVALRKESVDRNAHRLDWTKFRLMSLSARRAWIEIGFVVLRPVNVTVALRKESVDRNSNPATMRSVIGMSLSARRAWIEIVHLQAGQGVPVSLSARRAWIEIGQCPVYIVMQQCRSPQGERG